MLRIIQQINFSGGIYFDGFRELYGEQPNLTAQYKTTINLSSVVSGVKMTVTESIVSDKGAVVPTIEITNRKDLCYMISQALSEDKTKLITSLEIDSIKSLKSQTLTVVADKIINTATKEQTIDLLTEKDHE